MTVHERRFFFHCWNSLDHNCLLSQHLKQFSGSHPASRNDIFTWNDVFLAFREESNEERAEGSKPSPRRLPLINPKCLFTNFMNVDVYKATQ